MPISEQRAILERKLRHRYPADDDYTAALAVLETYGAESHEREIDRVRLAILKTSKGSLDNLHATTSEAKKDYRDALVAAEYPHDTWPMDEADRPAIDERNRRQYEDWLQEP